MLPVTVRLKTADDMNRVFSDWLRSYRNAPGMASIPNEVYFYWAHRILESYWSDPTCTFLVACSPEDPRKIFGWLCGQRAESLAGDQVIVHYVYVPKLYRRMGLASRLLSTFDTRPLLKDTISGPMLGGDMRPLVVTHRTDAGRELLRSRGVVVYNPFLAWARAPALGPNPPKQVVRARDPMRASRQELAFGGFPKDGETDEESAA